MANEWLIRQEYTVIEIKSMDRRDSFKSASNTTKSDASFNDFDHEEANIVSIELVLKKHVL